jgi:hypothetical protein
LGNLNTLNLIEIGPGSGLMMSDILRVNNKYLKLFLDIEPIHRKSEKCPSNPYRFFAQPYKEVTREALG